jgi:epoxyqueuosine reductase
VDSSQALTLTAQSVRAAATESGFDLCGVARAEPIPGQFLQSWLESGMSADMDWMSERVAERLDVARLVPGARTVIALACNYHREEPDTQSSPVASYARGRDYHYTMQDRLRGLRRRLRALVPGVQTYSSVDAGAMMEKVWAVRAGLGFVGKNGCLITPRFGSYVVLAAMVLDAPVDRYDDANVADRCGKCGLCIDACPTDAILHSVRQVDARRCLSFQTIENAGHIPLELREALDQTVFGCDICQTVCPLNDSPLVGGERFVPRAVAALGVRELAMLTEERFLHLAKGTPLMRAGFHGVRRNAAYALGAARDEAARTILETLARDPEPKVSEAAQWGLSRLQSRAT